MQPWKNCTNTSKSKFRISKVVKNDRFWAFGLSKSPKLISRKIWVAEKLINFHTVIWDQKNISNDFPFSAFFVATQFFYTLSFITMLLAIIFVVMYLLCVDEYYRVSVLKWTGIDLIVGGKTLIWNCSFFIHPYQGSPL